MTDGSDEDNRSNHSSEAGCFKSKTGAKRSSRRSKKPVPDEKKDETYWRRRQKNNMAAKRSREARRQKESELTKRATILELEHEKLSTDLDLALRENNELKLRLSKYEDVSDFHLD